jgi:hypothetical protein
MSAENKNCLINESACGRIEGNPVCPKCGMDERVFYPGQADLESALQNAKVNFWKTHAHQLEQSLRESTGHYAQEEQAKREREEIERRKSEETKRQAEKYRKWHEDQKRSQLEKARTQTEPDLHKRVKKILAEQLGIDLSGVDNSKSFIGDLGADSPNLVWLTMAVEY